QRRDFHHTMGLGILHQYQVIYLEDLRVANLVRNRRLGQGISDAGWGQFRTTLAYEAACAGKQVVLVASASTSQGCSGCRTRVEKSLRVCTLVRPSGGLLLYRDQNAASSLLWRGQARRGAVPEAAMLQRDSVGL